MEKRYFISGGGTVATYSRHWPSPTKIKSGNPDAKILFIGASDKNGDASCARSRLSD